MLFRGIPVYCHHAAPLDRRELDADGDLVTVPVLCTEISLPGYEPYFLVHPDRWDEFLVESGG